MSNVPLLFNVPLLNRKYDPVYVIVPWFDSVPDRYLTPVPLLFSSWVLVSVPTQLILPPLQSKPFPVKANVAPPDAASSTPPLSCRLPAIAPERLPENECVPPEKSSTPPDATVNVPPAYVLFPVNCSVPALAST